MGVADTPGGKGGNMSMVQEAIQEKSSLAYTPEELTGVLKLSLKTVYQLLNSGALKGRKITARRWRVSHENVMAFLNGPDDE